MGGADRGHAHRRGRGEGLAGGAQVVVGTNGQNLPLETGDNQTLDLLRWLPTAPADCQVLTRPVWVSTPRGRFGLRLIARRLSVAAAAAAQRRLNQTSRKTGRTPNALSQLLTGWVLLVSNFPDEAWTDESLLGLYRLPWPVHF